MLPSDPVTGKPRSTALALLMVLVIGVCWGAAFPLNRLVMTSGVPFAAYVFLQTTGAAVILSLVAIPLRQLPRLRSWRHLRVYFLMAFFGIGIPYYVLTIAAPKVPAGVLGLIQTVEPMMTYVFVLLFSLERFDRLRVGGLFVGLAGILLILVPEASLPSPEMAVWVAIGFSASVCWAFWAVLVTLVRPPAATSVSLASGYAVLCSLITFPAMPITGGWWFFSLPFDAVDWAVLAVTGINALLFYLSLECIRYAGAVIYSLWAYVGTMTAIGLGILFFGESHSVWIWASIALLVIGMTLVTQAGRWHRTIRLVR